MNKSESRFYFYILIVVLLLCSTILKFLYSDNLSLWLDEAYTVWFTERTWPELWLWVPQFESHPPFYYSFMKVWAAAFGSLSGISYRYASIFFSCVLFIISLFTIKELIYHLGLDTENSYLAASLLFLFSPIIFWYSVEARPYLLFTTSYLLAISSATKVMIRPQINRNWLLFSLGALLTNWSHNIGPLFSFTLYLAASLKIFSVTDKRPYALKLIYSAIAVTVLSIPLIYFIFTQLSHWSASTWIPEPTISSFKDITQEFLFPDYLRVFLKSNLSIYFADLASTILLIAIFGLIFVGLVNLRKRNSGLFILYVFSIAIVPIVTFAVSYYGPNVFLQRTLTPVLAPYFILLSISIGFINNKKISSAIILVIALNLSAGLYGKLQWGHKEPWEEITNTLANKVQENDVILLLPNSIRLPIEIYDPERLLSDSIFSLPSEYPAIGVSSFYPSGTPSVPGLTVTDIPRIDGMVKGKTRVFLLTRNEKLYDPDKIAVRLLSTRYSLDNQMKWSGINLYIFSSP